jgi:hypothetical protein
LDALVQEYEENPLVRERLAEELAALIQADVVQSDVQPDAAQSQRGTKRTVPSSSPPLAQAAAMILDSDPQHLETRILEIRIQALESRFVNSDGDDEQASKRARDFSSSEFQAAFRARLEEDLPVSQAFRDLVSRLQANAIKTRALQTQFEERTQQLHGEFIATRAEFGERLKLVEDGHLLLALPLAPFPSYRNQTATVC